MSVLDDVFSALAEPRGNSMIALCGVATLTGTIDLAGDDPTGVPTSLYIVATGTVDTPSLCYAPPTRKYAAAIRFSIALNYVVPENNLRNQSAAITLTRHATNEPAYTIDFDLPWANVEFVAKFDHASGVVFGSADNQLVALALSIQSEQSRKPQKLAEAASVDRTSVRRSRAQRRA